MSSCAVQVTSSVSSVASKKPPVSPSALDFKELQGGSFWRKVPAYRHVDEQLFLDHSWQSKHTITRVSKLLEALQDLVSSEFLEDVAHGFKRSPMSVRVSPYLLSLIDWSNPYDDPLRVQFIPVGSRLLPDHPKLEIDSLHEQEDAPVPGLTHRYRDKALFLALNTCPVYCRFCTRSYAVGVDTDKVEKVHLRASDGRWRRAYDYIASRPEASRTSSFREETPTTSALSRSPTSARRSWRCRTSGACASPPRGRRSCPRRS